MNCRILQHTNRPEDTAEAANTSRNRLRQSWYRWRSSDHTADSASYCLHRRLPDRQKRTKIRDGWGTRQWCRTRCTCQLQAHRWHTWYCTLHKKVAMLGRRQSAQPDNCTRTCPQFRCKLRLASMTCISCCYHQCKLHTFRDKKCKWCPQKTCHRGNLQHMLLRQTVVIHSQGIANTTWRNGHYR